MEIPESEPLALSRKQTVRGPTNSVCPVRTRTRFSAPRPHLCWGRAPFSPHPLALPAEETRWLPISGPGFLYPKELWEGPGHTCRDGAQGSKSHRMRQGQCVEGVGTAQ